MKAKNRKEKKNRQNSRTMQATVVPEFISRDALMDVMGGIEKASHATSQAETFPPYVRQFRCEHKHNGGECVHVDCWAHPSFLSEPEAEKTEVILYMADSIITSNPTWEPTEVHSS